MYRSTFPHGPSFERIVERVHEIIRREYAKLLEFKFKDELEERLMASLSAKEAIKEVAKIEADLAAFHDVEAKKRRKNKGKKSAKRSSDDKRAFAAAAKKTVLTSRILNLKATTRIPWELNSPKIRTTIRTTRMQMAINRPQ